MPPPKVQTMFSSACGPQNAAPKRANNVIDAEGGFGAGLPTGRESRRLGDL